jgi:4-carboxymuconolactone decarboxylase
VVRIPPGVKHWHGAAPTTAMTHVAIVEHLDGRSTDWMERVSDTQYDAPVRAREGATAPTQNLADDNAQPSRAQQLMGDIAPKLAQLTDDVLFGDV